MQEHNFLHTNAICLSPIHPSFKNWLRDRLISLLATGQKLGLFWHQILNLQAAFLFIKYKILCENPTELGDLIFLH